MIAWIDLHRKELLKVNGFSPYTVETYVLSIQAFLTFTMEELKVSLRRIKSNFSITSGREILHIG